MNSPPSSPPSAPPIKLPVAILGATGAVGQRFLALLADHPWFTIKHLIASDRSAGKTYAEATQWVLETPMPSQFAGMTVEQLDLDRLGGITIAFSALSASIAGDIETRLAAAGLIVFSNAAPHRMAPDVPLVIPEVNPDHLFLVGSQDHSNDGAVITNPNCSTVGLVLALAPLYRAFGIRRVSVVTEQALSGAGLVNGALMHLEDNVIPFIPGEEEKLAQETGKLLGKLKVSGSSTSDAEAVPDVDIEHASFPVSATCTRVPVRDGHLLAISLELETPASAQQIQEAWTNFRGLPQERELPSAPAAPLHVLEEQDAPQPSKHRNLEGGMAASIGRLRPDLFYGEEAGPEDARRGWKFITLSHNTVRGAAGGSILNAETWLAMTEAT
jgi:aspartate-semialdehyde dehydrogenase